MRSLRLLLLCGIAVAPLAARGGNRTLQTPARFLAGNTMPLTAVFAGDFTADGKQDVLVAESGKIRVMPGTGTGMFGAAVVSDSGTYHPAGLADFNGDARPDLYLIGAGQIAVMLGAVNGTFGAPVPVPSSVSAGQLVAGDFTGDGLRDLGVVPADADQIVVLAGNGNGSFPSSQATPVSVWGTLYGAVPGDFDGDGHVDIALIATYSTTVAWNSGTSFTLEALALSNGTSAAAGDVNGDGVADLIVSGADGTSVSFGKSTRGLSPVKAPAGASPGGDVAVAAMDGDTRSDVVVGGAFLTVLTHDGTAFRAPHFFDTGERAWGIAAADFTGDGKTDVVVIHYASSGATRDFFSLIPGKGDGALAANPAFDIKAALGTAGWGGEVFLLDMNGDARLDLIASTYFHDRIAVLFGRGDGTFDAPIFTTLPNAPYYGSIYDAGDLNGDGRRDVILWDPGAIYTTITFYVLFAQPNGSFLAGPAHTTPNGTGTAAHLQPILDYTGDGKADLLDTGGRILSGNGNGTFGPAIATGINTWARDTSVADVNGDGRPDLLVGFSFTLTTYLNTGGGTFAAPVAGPLFWIRCTADMNGDGFADLLNGGVSFGDGAGHFTGSGFAIDLASPCVAIDVDGDGKLDAASTAATYFGAGGGIFDAAAQNGIDITGTDGSGTILSTADFDGNGSPDLWLSLSGLLKIIRTRTGGAGTAAPAVEVSTTPNPSPYPSWFQPRATITGTAIKPRGAVLFSYDSAPPSALLLVDAGSMATDYHPTIPVGTSTTITATFLGDEYYGPGSASSTHTVERGSSTVTCKTNKSTYEVGQAIVVLASLRGNYGGSPTGTITYRKGGTVIGSQPASAGQGYSFTDPLLFPIGTHTLTTEYSGDGNYLPSQSAPRTIAITKVTPAMALAVTAGPLTDTQQVTLTASFPNQPGVTGSVAFTCFGQTLGSVAVSSAQAVLTRTLPWGEGACYASYGGSHQYAAAGAFQNVTVYHAAMPAAPLISATAAPGGHVASLAISPISGAVYYDIYGAIDGGAWGFRRSAGSAYTTDNVGDAKVAVYAAVARTESGTTSALGPPDLVTFVTFTDDPLIASTTIIKSIHLTELQTAVNAVRLAASLTATTFAAPTGIISAAHLTSLRQALTQARGALGLSTPITDTTISPGVTRVRAIHLQELRDAVK